ncbi:hypothetical protein C8Z91_33470 [Paenibacillus elgii]|uniref:Type I restriction modification DNA specificity domain-containing protein n=1 Tax=Paenibacillus elgii TaxID=189691 RepID=A0A2T6FSA1_9BACL|nr:restriction endonuclease subunit S [Paenibacillus elgii]PUA34788.1 hypothetical protein C8Z91_33470 [Paenibacillus elgii]
MAKGKKQNLSAEVLLEQALVPEDEQPYELPMNWIWTKLGNVCTEVQYGYTAKSSTDEIGPKLLRITDIQDGGVDWSNVPFCEISQVEYSKFKLDPNDIVVARTGATTGKSYLISEHVDSVFASYLIRVKLNNLLNYNYLFYFMQSNLYWGQITELAQGIAQPGVNATKLQTMSYPLPPLAEQQRIVDRIESLFAKLDQAKELAQNALDSFETRKAAILHKALTGELTAKWRESQGLSMDSWKTMPLSKLAYIQTGLAKGKQINSVTTTMPYLRVANVQDGYLDLSEIKLITVEKDKIERYRLKEGDVLFTEGGDYDKLGRGTVWRAEIDNCLHQNHVFAVRPESTVLNSFYLAYLASSRYGKTYFLSCSKQTTNLASINSTQLKAFPVFCPSIIEQQEIVRILDTLIEKEQSAKYKLELLLDQIDLMKKSILARAFCGELGTNDPSEESALELLKEVVLPQ